MKVALAIPGEEIKADEKPRKPSGQPQLGTGSTSYL